MPSRFQQLIAALEVKAGNSIHPEVKELLKEYNKVSQEAAKSLQKKQELETSIRKCNTDNCPLKKKSK